VVFFGQTPHVNTLHYAMSQNRQTKMPRDP
jgi:hypothetical protein